MPFTSQAPHQNWNQPYQDFCEEAAVLMAASYILHRPISSPEDADRELLKIQTWEESYFGYSKAVHYQCSHGSWRAVFSNQEMIPENNKRQN